MGDSHWLPFITPGSSYWLRFITQATELNQAIKSPIQINCQRMGGVAAPGKVLGGLRRPLLSAESYAVRLSTDSCPPPSTQPFTLVPRVRTGKKNLVPGESVKMASKYTRDHSRVNLRDGQTGDRLAVDNATETRLVFNDTVRHTHLPAQRRQTEYDLQLANRWLFKKNIECDTSFGDDSSTLIFEYLLKQKIPGYKIKLDYLNIPLLARKKIEKWIY